MESECMATMGLFSTRDPYPFDIQRKKEEEI